MTEPKCPQGYRFLVQFVDCESIEEAAVELSKMFGTGTVAVILPGSCNVLANPNRIVPQAEGWTVFVPVEWRIP